MDNLSNVLMPVVIGIIMYGIGLNLKFKDFARVFIKPKAIITGLLCQLLLLPLIAFALVYFWPIDPVYKVGIIIIASAPGGTASNLVTYMLEGRVALSVSLTSFNSFAILFSIPVYLHLALYTFLGTNANIDISFADTNQKILFTVVLPVVAGILTNQYTLKEFTDKIRKPSRIVLPLLLLGVFTLAMFFGEENQTLPFLNNLDLLIPLIIFNIVTMFAGFYISRFVGTKHDANYTIAIEMGLQNAALAIFVASSIVGNQKMELVAVIYSSFTFFSTLIIGWLMKRYMNFDAKKLK